ncbi:MAG TPA: 6-pyruvoyl-tetrahydropterin synthase-related protein, partial [bacterium]|nr:6-pyruvoyl-tetrahydropterin synthase-related protein [bacterium]
MNFPRLKKTDVLLVLLSTLPIFKPLLNPKFFWSHENAYFLWRLASFHQNVVDGAVFCRWFPDFARGLGLPFLEFYPVLPLYISELFRCAGFPVIPSVKLGIVVITFFAALGGYLLGRDIWGRRGGVITSVLISYAPYKMVNLYVRGDINEIMAMASLPWALWIIWRQLAPENNRPVSVPAILIFSIPCLSHYPSCVIQYPVIVLWILSLCPAAERRWQFLFRNFLSLATAMAVTSTFWLSAFMSRHLVQMEGMTQGFADYSKHFIAPFQWVSFYWNYGASVRGPGDAISFQLGNLALIATVIGIPHISRMAKSSRPHRLALYAVAGTLLISLFLMLRVSSPVWETIPILPMLQFPYRLLVIPAVMLPILGGAIGGIIDSLVEKYRFGTTLFAVIVCVAASLPMCRVATYLNTTEADLDPESIRRA